VLIEGCGRSQNKDVGREEIWLVTFMDYDRGYFDDETCRLEPLENPFGAKVLPMSPV
jgi:putative transposase